MTWRGTGLFAAGLVLAGLLVWWSQPPGPAARRAAAKRPLLPASPEVTRIDLTLPSRTLRLARAAGGWRSGTGAPIDVESLLAALRSLEPLMVVGLAPRDLGRFGLDPPAVRLTVWSRAARLLDLEVGGRNPAWTGLYARRDERSEIELLGAVLYWEIEKLLATTTPPGNA